VQAEHRGYGQSLTSDPDQTVPAYVRIDQVLADAHRVILELRDTYVGPWMAAGRSYGGGLVIEFAVRYPDDVSVILSSSGVVDWPFVMDAYDRQIRKTLGGDACRRLAEHATNLAPATLFDEAWLEREFLIALVHGVVQMGRMKQLQPYFTLLSHLPTRAFLEALHWMDNRFGEGEARRYALSNARRTLTREEALTGAYGWRVWRYQQRAQTGVFEVPVEPGGLMTRAAPDYVDECRALFGEDPPAATAPPWSPRARVETLRVPLVYVSGGMDPWAGLGLEPDDPFPRGRYFHRREGRHCPDQNDLDLAGEVLAEMLRYARNQP
jgi:pimeloyl-ACP methyl ester carboxylesterase